MEANKMTYHDLEALLAEVAGVEITPHYVRRYVPDYGTSTVAQSEFAYVEILERHTLRDTDVKWTPLTDHSQMALVKAGLRKADYLYSISWNDETAAVGYRNLHVARVYHSTKNRAMAFVHEYTHRDELRALAEAVAKMKA